MMGKWILAVTVGLLWGAIAHADDPVSMNAAFDDPQSTNFQFVAESVTCDSEASIVLTRTEVWLAPMDVRTHWSASCTNVALSPVQLDRLMRILQANQPFSQRYDRLCSYLTTTKFAVLPGTRWYSL